MFEALGLVLFVLIVVGGAASLSLRRTFVVYEWQYGLLYRNGRFQKLLEAGRHQVWRYSAKVEVFFVHKGPLFSAAGPLDATTADRFPLRVGASIAYRVVDARHAYENAYPQRLGLAANEELTAVVAGRTLDELLAERTGLGEQLSARLNARLPDLEIASAAINAITLPPEIRRLATEVERAKREGLAALERARGEHAALRALANAARMLKDNPELMHLRVLQAVSPTGKGATLVLGQGGLALGPPAGKA